MEGGIRIDKWLWAVRIFKTRNQAGEACRGGRVSIDGQVVKPSREVHAGDEVVIRLKTFTKTVLVKSPLKNRVGAKLVDEFMEDITPAEEYEKLKLQKEVNYEYRQRGTGRPTKKHRRLIERLKRSKF